MNLKMSVKVAVATAMLGASVMASAQTTVPTPQPQPIPAAGLLSNTAASDPVYVAVWDPVTGASLTEYLGLNAGQISPSQLTNTLDFGTLSGFSTTFASEISGGTQSSLQFAVFSTGTSNGGATTSVYTTSRNAASDAVFDNTANIAANAGGAIQGGNAAINDWTVNRANAANTCNKVNPCTAANANDPRSFALPAFADNYGGNITGFGSSDTHTSGSLGTSMSFYLLTADNSDPFAPVTSDAKYNGKWSVSTAGDLTYVAAVPLPAAAWLLLSGLAGLGAIGRRRNGAAVAA